MANVSEPDYPQKNLATLADEMVIQPLADGVYRAMNRLYKAGKDPPHHVRPLPFQGSLPLPCAQVSIQAVGIGACRESCRYWSLPCEV